MAEHFNVEAHYESKIKKGSIKDQGSVLRFTRMPFEPKKKEIQKGLRKIATERFKYSDFEDINKLHLEYLQELRGGLSSSAFMDILYKAELTGAKIEIAGRTGFVLEERKNSLFVIFPGNLVKIYPKKLWDFSLEFEGIKYLFFSEALKKGRFLKI